MEHTRRQRALRQVRVLSVLDVAVGVALLILALVSRENHGPPNNGVPPYYIGPSVVFVAPAILGVLGFAMYVRGRHCLNKLEAAARVGCIMQAYCVLSIVTIALCFVAMIITGVTGICISVDCSYINDAMKNRALAVTSLVIMITCTVICVIHLFVLWKSANSFGVRLLTRGQFQITDIAPPAQDTYEEPGQAVTPVVPREHHHIEHHEDPRLATPPPDFSTHHLQHYLTQQYRDRIRKRRKKNKRKRNHQVADGAEGTTGSNGEPTRRQRERQAPYVLPPVVTPFNLPTMPTMASFQAIHSPRSAPVRPPTPETHHSPSPPPALRVVYPPPSPPPPPSNTPPTSPDLTSPSPPAPPSSPPGIVHVIPYGGFTEEEDDEPPPYSP